MNAAKTVAIVGGDLRSAHLANTLAEKHSEYQIFAMFLENCEALSAKIKKSNDLRLVLGGSEIVIFPLPLLDSKGFLNTPKSESKTTVNECLNCLNPGAVALAGMVPREIHVLANECGVKLIDYFLREEFAILNSVPTAEGAIELAIREMPVTLFNSTCLVIGYGRVSKALSRLLKAFGADVCVAARSHSDLAQAKINGLKTVHINDMNNSLRDVDCLFNTVPVTILGEEKLAVLPRRCLIIDLASKPGGVDFDAVKKLGIKTIWALSLPGKTAPHSAGEIILSTIINILNERGIA